MLVASWYLSDVPVAEHLTLEAGVFKITLSGFLGVAVQLSFRQK